MDLCAGPVVRITPDEIHLSDPENYEKIYYVGSKFWKDPLYYDALGLFYSTHGALTNDVHSVRRAALNPFFSRKMVLELENVVQEKVEKLVRRASRALEENEPINVHHGFRAISVDVITDYAFNNCYNLLDRSDLGGEFLAMVRGLGPAWWFFQQWPSIQPLAFKTPKWLAEILSKPLDYI